MEALISPWHANSNSSDYVSSVGITIFTILYVILHIYTHACIYIHTVTVREGENNFLDLTPGTHKITPEIDKCIDIYLESI